MVLLAEDPIVTLRLRPIAPTDWPAISAGFGDLNFEQTLAYSQAGAVRVGAKLDLVGLMESDVTWRAVVALRVKTLPGLSRGIAWAPSGPLVQPRSGPAPDRAMLTALLAAFRQSVVEEQGHVLRLRLPGSSQVDADAAHLAGFTPAPRPRAYHSFALDLSQDKAQLMAALQGKWRTDLRFALKSGLMIDRGQGPVIEARFMILFDRVQAAKSFNPDIPPGFHFPLSGPEYRVETLIAVKDGQDVAGIVTGTCAASSTYLFGATDEPGRPLRAGYLLQWEAIRLAREAGCLWYDLGGVDFNTNPEVSRFKERMNGVPILSEVWQARPPGLVGGLILGLEALRARVKGR